MELRLGRAKVVFSDRRGGVSEGPYESLNLGILTDGDPERVAENRRRLAGDVGLHPSRVAMGWQVHGTEMREWEGPPESPAFAEPLRPSTRQADLPRVDGHTTKVPGLGLLVLVADCLPVALAGGGRVAMLHCGWRGLAEGIVARGLEVFAEPPAAALGPGIGACCYEVGPEVLERFEGVQGAVKDRHLDLRAVADHQLRAGGVTQIEHVDDCTSCRPELYFSHRRDGGVTGRQGGLVVLDA
jgi:polyphenol oxidase